MLSIFLLIFSERGIGMTNQLQVEIVKGDKNELKFEFVENRMKKRQVVVGNLTDQEIVEGDRWMVNVVSSEKKGPVTVNLVKRIEVAPIALIDALPDFWIESKKLQHIQILLLNGKDIILKGHRGTGKTDLVIRLARACNWTFCKVDCGMLQRPNDLFGSEAAENAGTIWKPSDFWNFCQQAMQIPEQKSLLLLDEINRMHAKIAEGLHGLYDHTRQISFTTSEGTKVLRLPPNVMSVATMNFGTQYAGIFNLDSALKDRFVVIPMEYLPPEFEEEMLIKKHSIHKYQAKQIVAVANSLREAEQSGLLQFSPSPRLTDAAAILVKYRVTVADAVETAFLGDYDRGLTTINGNGSTTEDGENATELAQAKSHIRKFLSEAIIAA